jgi:hypothetical protein
MVGPGYSDAPDPAWIQKVVDSFRAHGVTLHIDPHHTAIPAHEVIVPDWPGVYASQPGFDDPSCTGPDAVRFSDLRRQYFQPSSNHPWHYAVFGDYVFTDSGDDSSHCPTIPGTVLPQPGMTGYSQLGFDDVEGGLGYNFVVAVKPIRDCPECFLGTGQAEAAIFMHELGHNLGLCHGGADLHHCSEDDGAEGKPNYLSVMNPDFESIGIPYASTPGSTTIAGYRLDYSDTQLPDLDERNLDETVGLQDTAHPTDISFSDGIDSYIPASGPVDWNQNGETTDTGLRINLDDDPFNLTVLHGADDWAWIHSRLTPPAITGVSLDGNVVTVSGVNLIGPPQVLFSGGATASVYDVNYDLSPETSFRVHVPVGARSGPITVVTPDGNLTSSQSLTITGHATGSGDIAAGPGDTVWFTEPDGNRHRPRRARRDDHPVPVADAR